MSKVYSEITSEIVCWVERQKIFFVSSAPLSTAGHINCSPKGLDTLRVIDAHTVAYADLTGSGAETVAHLRENGRIVLMFCAFEGTPKIVRFHGKGQVVLPHSERWQQFAARMPIKPSTRAIILIHVTRVSDSCGFGVPVMQFSRNRDVMDRWVESKGLENLPAFRDEHNVRSIDGLPTADFK